MPPPAPKTESATPNAGRPVSSVAQSQSPPTHRQPPHQHPYSQPHLPQRKVGLLLGLGIFVFPYIFVWFLLRRGYSALSRTFGFGWLTLFLVPQFLGSPQTTATRQPAANVAAPALSIPTQDMSSNYSPPEQSQAPSRPEESMPPIGQNLVLNISQIRYCLAEDIRLDGAKSAVNNYINSDVDRFNMMVADYNSRCGRFLYREGALESARRDIEPYRGVLFSEGGERFSGGGGSQSSANGNYQNQYHQSAAAFGPSVSELNFPTTHRPAYQPLVSGRANRDTTQDEVMERLRRDAEDRRDQRERAERISSTPGAHKQWDYRVGRDIWVDAYGNPIEQSTF